MSTTSPSLPPLDMEATPIASPSTSPPSRSFAGLLISHMHTDHTPVGHSLLSAVSDQFASLFRRRSPSPARVSHLDVPTPLVAGSPQRVATPDYSRLLLEKACYDEKTGVMSDRPGFFEGNHFVVRNDDGYEIEMALHVQRSNTGNQIYAAAPLTQKQVLNRFRARIDERFRQDLANAIALNRASTDTVLRAPHICIGMAMDYLKNICKANKTPLNPLDPQFDQLMQSVASIVSNAADTWDWDDPNGMAVHEAFRGNFLNADMHQAFKALNDDAFAGTPFGAIDPAKRHLLCVDPIHMALLQKQFETIAKPDFRLPARGEKIALLEKDEAFRYSAENPLLSLIFNNELDYLQNMGDAWNFVMEAWRNNTELDEAFILELHRRSAAATGYPGILGKRTQFPLYEGKTASAAGIRELKEFLRDFSRLNKDFPITLETNVNGVLVISHPEIKPEIVSRVVRDSLKTYRECLAKARTVSNPQRRSDAIVDAALRLSKTFEVLHIFGDGNCRNFAVLLLNSLLVREGEPLTMLDNPNKMDGFSIAELRDLARKGQAMLARATSETTIPP